MMKKIKLYLWTLCLGLLLSMVLQSCAISGQFRIGTSSDNTGDMTIEGSNKEVKK